MKEKAFDDWQQFKSEFAEYLPAGEPTKPIISNFLFRGQKNENWGIVSSFDRRKHAPSNASDKLREMQKFYEYLMRFIGSGPTGTGEFEKAARAQHYGVPTRLIDWTQSPYVASFFAFFDAAMDAEIDLNSRIAIFALHLPTFREHSVNSESFKLHDAPNVSNYRQRNQRGNYHCRH